MRVHAVTNKVLFTRGTEHGWGIVKVKSKSNPNIEYTVDMTFGRCDCPAWKFQKGGERVPCKHLRALGFKQVLQNETTFSESVQVTEPAYETEYEL